MNGFYKNKVFEMAYLKEMRKMNFVRKVANSDILASIIDIPESLKNKKVEILILPIEDDSEEKQVLTHIAKARGSLKKYSNIDLIPEEENIWEKVMKEKYENS